MKRILILLRRTVLTLVALAMVLAIPLGAATPVAAQEDDRGAHIVVTAEELGLNIERAFSFEAALHIGTEPGEETSGRITEWAPSIGNEARIRLPAHTLAGQELPWDEEDAVYVRVRTTDVSPANPYPIFNLTSEAFTLEDRLYNLDITIEHTQSTVAADRTEVAITLVYQGFTFDVIGPWQASLYAQIPDADDVCYTEFKPSVGGTATIVLPDDVKEGEEMLWGVDNYAHVRPVQGVYPYIELAGALFPMNENEVTNVLMSVSHTLTDEALPDEEELIGVDDYVIYTVVRGDTLSSISRRAYGTAVRYPEIVAATNQLAEQDTTINAIVNPDRIGVGWRIVVPDPIAEP